MRSRAYTIYSIWIFDFNSAPGKECICRLCFHWHFQRAEVSKLYSNLTEPCLQVHVPSEEPLPCRKSSEGKEIIKGDQIFELKIDR